MRRSSIGGVKAWALPGLLAATAIAGPAWAQQAQTFNIPSQDLPTALEAFGRQSGKEILFDRREAAGRRSGAAVGDYTADAALRRLLGGSGLALRQVNADTFLVEPTPPQDRAAPSGGETTSVDDVIVSALRRNERVQDAPAAITAITGETLRRLGASDFNDYYRTVPSLQITNNSATAGQSRVSLRGIWTAGESTVGLYYGETPVTGPNTTSDPGLQTPNLTLFDVNRVEVLRGPQGTLYGAGSVAGTIRVVFEQPDPNTFGGHVEAEVSTTDHGGESSHFRGAVNLPLIQDKLGLRLVGYTEEIGGYVDNVRLNQKDVNTGEINGGRAILAWTPSETFSLTGSAIYQESRLDDNLTWYQAYGAKAYKTDQWLHIPYNDDLQLYNATLNWTLPFAKLTATSSYYEWNLERNTDPNRNTLITIAGLQPASPACRRYYGISASCSPAQLADFKTFATGLLPVSFNSPMSLDVQIHEIRLSSLDGGWFDWTVGAFYEKREDLVRSNTARADAITGDLFDPLLVDGRSRTSTDFTQFSQFVEVAVRPAPGLTVTGGVRHYDYDKDVSSETLEASYLSGSVVGPARVTESARANWVGKLNVAYKFTDNLLGYVQWAQGFRPGGANNIIGLAESLVVYDPDSLDSYEAGFKGSWANGRYTLNTAAFQIDWKGIQTSLTVPPSYRATINAGDARIQGLEIEGAARPFAGLSLTGGLAWIPKADLTAIPGPDKIILGAQDGIVGDRIPYSAKFTAAVSAEYDWPISGTANAYVRADVNYHGETANSFRPTWVNYEELTDFTEVNARAGIENGDWGVHLFVKNLTNIVGALNVQSGAAPAPYQNERQLSSLRPRTIGLNVTRQF
jgi:iron complex outermembrane receptor protein